MKEYMLIENASLFDLERAVNNMLEKGWDLHGAPTVYKFRPDNDPRRRVEETVIQSMIREK